jgi:transketolase
VGEVVPDYKKLSAEIRLGVLKMLYEAKGSFAGGSLSAADIVTVLYHGGYMRKSGGQSSPFKDVLVLSKGHSSSVMYSALKSVGVLTQEQLDTYALDGTKLCIHPKRNNVPGVVFSTGALGHGLAMAAGSALGAKIQGVDSRVYVLLGDGECNEGSVWENIPFAVKQKLDNLTIIVDRNCLQGCGRDVDVLNYGDMADKFRAFGCDTVDIDGHNYTEIETALMNAGKKGIPAAIIANTVKGKGVSFIEDRVEWHYKSMTPEQYEQAVSEVRL